MSYRNGCSCFRIGLLRTGSDSEFSTSGAITVRVAQLFEMLRDNPESGSIIQNVAQ